MTFLPIEDSDKMVVNHIDEIVTNNNIRNLEWCTVKENTNFGTGIERNSGKNHWLYGKHISEETKEKIRQKLLGRKIPNHKGGYPKKPVMCIETGAIYESCAEAARAIGSTPTLIVSCCKGRIHTTGKSKDGLGLHWKYI